LSRRETGPVITVFLLLNFTFLKTILFSVFSLKRTRPEQPIGGKNKNLTKIQVRFPLKRFAISFFYAMLLVDVQMELNIEKQ